MAGALTHDPTADSAVPTDPSPLITASRNLTRSDKGVLVNATANTYTLTIPAGMPGGWSAAALCTGAGKITFGAGAGVTLNEASGLFSTGGQYKAVALLQVGADAYVLTGSTGA